MSLAKHLGRGGPPTKGGRPTRDGVAPIDFGVAIADDALSAALSMQLAGPEKSRVGGAWIHASQLYSLCTRQVVLGREARARGERLTEVLGAPRRLRYDVGNAVHDLTRRYLADTGRIEGWWKCRLCGVEDQHLQRRPEACAFCREPGSVDYREPEFVNVEHQVIGHVDGIDVDPRRGRGPIEIKSADGSLFRLKNYFPRPEHVFRVHVYCWLAGMKWGRLLYVPVSMETKMVRPFKEFLIHYDLRVPTLIVKRLAELRDGIGVKVCKSADDPRAAECPVAGACWKR